MKGEVKKVKKEGAKLSRKKKRKKESLILI